MATEMLESFSSSVVKTTSVNFIERTDIAPVELSQYDDSEDGSLVCIKVEMYKGSERYEAPADTTVRLRFGMFGGYFAYYQALGFLGSRSVVIIPVRLQMTLIYGDFQPEIEIITEDGSTVASAPFSLRINKAATQLEYVANWVKTSDIFDSVKKYDEIMEAVNNALERMNEVYEFSKVLILSATNVSSLPLTINNAAITSDMVCIEAVFTNPYAVATNWAVDSYDGKVIVSGTISGSTDVQLHMLRSRTS